jgi:uncharacterized membrane protein YeaQ/YmgE (transglycosylase-associated protein family)
MRALPIRGSGFRRLPRDVLRPAGSRPRRLEEDCIMPVESLLVLILVGAIAGWLAGLIVKGFGFGLVGNIVVGILGALIATWLFPRLGVSLGRGVISAIISSTLGAVILLVIVGLIRRA